jgi:maleate isomerase
MYTGLNQPGRIRVGLIVPSSNTVMENDLHLALPKPKYTVHTDRMYLTEATRAQEIQMIEDYAPAAARDLGTLNPDVLVFGCTSAGSLFGLDYDAKVCEKLSHIANCPTIGVITAVSEALKSLQAKDLAVITPYNEDLTQSVANALKSEFNIVASYGMGITDNIALAAPSPEEITEFAKVSLKGLKFDTLFVSCTNFRAFEALALLKEALGTPVVTSNSAIIQALLKLGN